MKATLLIGLLLVPTASACSLAGSPPAPGVLFAWTPGEDPSMFAVEKRSLGGTCELANTVAYAGDWLAWREGDDLVWRTVAGGEGGVVPAVGPVDLLGVANDTAWLVRHRGVAEAEAFRVDLRAGIVSPVPLDGPPLHASRLAGSRLAWSTGSGDDLRLGVVDLAGASAWNATGDELGLTEAAFLHAWSPDWFVFVPEAVVREETWRVLVYEVAAAGWREWSVPRNFDAQVMGDQLVWRSEGPSPHLIAVDLHRGERVDLGPVDQTDLMAGDGDRFALGVFSVDWLDGAWQRLAEGQFGRSSPGLPLGLALVALAAMARRR